MSKTRPAYSKTVKTQLPQIPSVPASADADLAGFLNPVKETIEVREGKRGNALDRFVSVRDLTDPEFGRYLLDNDTSILNASVSSDSIAPNPPTNLVVTNFAFSNQLTWTNPGDEDLSHIEVWIATSSQLRANAVLTGIVTQPVAEYLHSVSLSATGAFDHTYWVRAVDWSGNKSTWEPAGEGINVAGEDTLQGTIDALLDVMTGQITDSQLATLLSTRIDTIEQLGVDNEGNIVNAQGDIVFLQNEVIAIQGDLSTKGTLIASNASQITLLAQNINEIDGELVIQASAIEQNASSITSTVEYIGEATAIVEEKIGILTDDLDTFWTVRINTDNGDGNPCVAGVGLYVSDSVSTFIVQANSFGVMNVENGVTSVPFVVDGTGVGIQGNLIVDGTIMASALQANDLSSIRADLGEVIAGIVKAGDSSTTFLNLNSWEQSGQFLRSGVSNGLVINHNGQFIFGDWTSGGPYISWDNSALTINGEVISTSNMVAESATSMLSNQSSGNEAYLEVNVGGDYPVIIFGSMSCPDTTQITISRRRLSPFTTGFSVLRSVTPSGGSAAMLHAPDRPNSLGVASTFQYRLYGDESSAQDATITVIVLKR